MTEPHTDPVPDLRRLWDAVPGGHPPVAAMTLAGRRRRQQRRATVAGLAAAAVVATGGGVWAATTGGSPTGRDDAGQVATDPAGTTDVTVYYTNDPGADVGGGGFVIPQLVPRRLEAADTGDPAYDALHALLTTPPVQPQLRTGFNFAHDLDHPDEEGLTIDVASITQTDHVVTVDLTRDPWDPYPRDVLHVVDARLAVQQLVHTAQDALDTDAPVTLTFGGQPVRGVWARRFDWPMAADPDVLTEGAAENAPRVVDLPTSSWQYGNPARLALGGGTLRVDESGCPFFGDAQGPRTYPVWPEDYSATLSPDGRLEVRRADGLLVAVDGDRLSVGGASATAESRAGCIPADADEVWLVEEELPLRATR